MLVSSFMQVILSSCSVSFLNCKVAYCHDSSALVPRAFAIEFYLFIQ